MDIQYDWTTWSQFFKENWIVLAVALVILLAVIGIVKTVAKWALVAVIVIGIVVYSGYSLQDLKDLGTKVTDSVKEQAVNAMVGEAQDATYTNNGDGTYTVKTKNIELTGSVGGSEVAVSYRGTPLGTWKIDGTIQELIDRAKNGV